MAGLEDGVVPYAENGARFAKRFLQAGGTLFITLKPRCGHHPHSLEDPESIAHFLDGAAREGLSLAPGCPVRRQH